MTTAEAAAELGVKDRRIRQMIRDGDLPAEKAGRDWLIEPKALARAARERQKPPPRGRPYKQPQGQDGAK